MAIIRQYHKDTDTTYVYESESYWVPELGQSRSKRRCLGKIDPETGEIVPCGKRGPKKQKPETSPADRQAYQKLQVQYEQSRQEVTRLRMNLSEKEKELAEMGKQNRKLADIIQQIRNVVAEH